MEQAMHMAPRQALTDGELKKRAPSVFADKAWSKMSENYTFVPTTMVMEALKKMGMVPVSATQRKAKHDPTVARHMVRFAKSADLKIARQKDETLPEVVLVNSHNGRSAFKMYYGLYRLVCSNGLVVSDATVGMTKRHMGDLKSIMEEAENVLSQGGKVIKQVVAMKAIKLTEAQRIHLAEEALRLRYLEENRATGKPAVNTTILPPQLLEPRRAADAGTDLWRTFNVIQENIITGGLTGKSAQGRVTHTRALQDVRKLVSVNTGLWDAAQKLLKKAA